MNEPKREEVPIFADWKNPVFDGPQPRDKVQPKPDEKFPSKHGLRLNEENAGE